MPLISATAFRRQENAPGPSPGDGADEANSPNEVPDPRPSAPPPDDSAPPPPPDESPPDPRPSSPPDDPEPQPDPEPQDPPPEPEPQDPPPQPDPRPSDPPAPDPEPEPQPSGETDDETTTRPPPPEPSSTTSDVSSTTDRPRPSSNDDDDETSSTSRRSEGGTSVAVDVITITSDGEIYTSTRTSTHFLPPETAISLPADPESSSSTTNTGAIAGGVVGGVGALAILTVLAILALKRWRRKQQEKEFDGNFDPVFVSRGSTSVSGLEAGSGGGGGVVEEKKAWRKSLGLRSGANREVEPDAPRVEDATLPRIDLEDEPPIPVNPFMAERDGSGIIGGIPTHSTGSSASASSHVRSGSLPPTPYFATGAPTSTASFGVNGAPMGMGGHTDSSGSSIHHSRALSLHSAGSSPLADVGTGSPPLPPPSAR